MPQVNRGMDHGPAVEAARDAPGATPGPARARWRRLTDAHPAIERAHDRRRARLLASLLIVLAPLGLLTAVATPLLAGLDPHVLVQPTTLVGAGACGALFVAYGLARTPRWERAAVLTVAVALAGAWGAALLDRAPADGTDPFVFVTLPVLLSSWLLPPRHTAAVALLNVVGLATLPLWHPTFGVDVIQIPLAFVVLLSALLVVASRLMASDLDQIQAQAARIADSERRYRTLFEGSFEALVVHADGVVLDTNTRLAPLLGLAEREVVGRPLCELVAPSSWPDVGRGLADDIGVAVEAMAVRADGTQVAVEVVSRPLLYQGRQAHVTALRDLTSRHAARDARRRADRLEAATARLEELDRLKTQLIHTTAHELNTPLTPLRLQLQLLQKLAASPDDPRRARSLAILDRNLERLTRLVRDMLDVARLQTGTWRLQRRRTDVVPVLRDVVDSFQPAAAAAGVVLQLDAPRDLRLDVDGDRIGQVLFNLVANALKFTPEGGWVGVTAGTAGADAVIRVRDTGVGIRPEDVARLFQPFSQVHEEGQAAPRGSGLGLYISKGIIEAHGGRMACESAGPGLGSAFTVALPLPDPRVGARTAAPDDAAPDALDVGPPGPPPSAPGDAPVAA